MKKIALLAGGKLELRYPEDEIALQDGMVKVHVSACGICGSDLALLSGKRDVSKELYFGHEFSGVVTEVSEGSVKIEPGMRVASEVSRTCGTCWYCLNGLSEYCRSLNDAITPGGFTEYTLARSTPDYSFLSPVPDAIDDVTAALMERVLAVVSPESAPIKRIVQDSREIGMLIDASFGRKTKSVLIMDTGHTILSALTPEAVAQRSEEGEENDG